MAWIALIVAGIGEVTGVIGINLMKQSTGIKGIALLVTGFVLSFTLLSFAMTEIEMSTAYAVWTGIGTIGSTIIGMLLYGESKDWRRILFIGLVISAAIGLKITS